MYILEQMKYETHKVQKVEAEFKSYKIIHFKNSIPVVFAIKIQKFQTKNLPQIFPIQLTLTVKQLCNAKWVLESVEHWLKTIANSSLTNFPPVDHVRTVSMQNCVEGQAIAPWWRKVVDTNAWISGCGFAGPSEKCLARGNVVLLSNNDVRNLKMGGKKQRGLASIIKASIIDHTTVDIKCSLFGSA